MNITIYQQNPMINFRKIALNQQKSQDWRSPKIPFKCMKKMHENMKIRTKRGIKWSYRPWGRKTLQKFRKKTTKNFVLPCQVEERERKVWKNFWKCVWISQRTVFLKTWNTMFDWSKNKFDQSNQAEAHWIF